MDLNINGQFFFVKDNKPVGPFTLDELLEKDISKKTYIWTKGMTNWEKIESIPVILEKLNYNLPPVFIEPKSEGNNIPQKGKGVNKIILFAFIGIIVLVLGFIGFRFTKGAGELIWPNGEKYVGELINGLPNGIGTQTWPDGKKYVGEFKDGKRNGQGTLTSISGDKYVGEFINGLPNGLGTKTWADGKIYVGKFKDGKRNGQGTNIRADSIIYLGEFKDDIPNGQATVTWPNGYKYVGEIKDDKFNGQGTFTYPNGDKYVGEFKDNKYNGQGTYTFSNGDEYVGEYKDDKYIGEFNIFNQNNQIQDEYINNSNYSDNNSSGNLQPTEQQCNYCKGTGNCSLCSKVYQVRYYDFGYNKGWKIQNETRKGYIMCSECYGSGVNYKMDAGNWVIKDECYVGTCNSGWIPCNECNSRGYGTNIGSCKHCRGTGSRN